MDNLMLLLNLTVELLWSIRLYIVLRNFLLFWIACSLGRRGWWYARDVGPFLWMRPSVFFVGRYVVCRVTAVKRRMGRNVGSVTFIQESKFETHLFYSYSFFSPFWYLNWSHIIFVSCGGAIGVYFLVKRCLLLYLYAGNGSFVQAPYLDAHGEVDASMRWVI